jgi:hypothetical protein
MLPEIQDLVARFVFASSIHHYVVNMPVLSWLRPGGELQWTIQTPNDMAKCACIGRAWNAALKQRKHEHVGVIAARVVKMALEYSMNICEVENYFSDVHGLIPPTTFVSTLRLDKTHLFSICFTRQRVGALKYDLHELSVHIGAPARAAQRLSDTHVSLLPDSCWKNAIDMCDDELDDFRLWYTTKKRELEVWLKVQLVPFGVMPLAQM